jgi:hypothetical protein
MRFFRWLLTPIFGLAVAACSEPPPPSPPPVPSVSKPPALPPPAPPPRAVTLEEATQLINGLAEAERRGNCQAVETHFSSRFVGVRGALNAQERLVKVAWLGWLKPLCSIPSKLEIHHIALEDAHARFVADGPWGSKYRFAEDRSDVYENIIERTLLLGWEGDQLRILGEERIDALNQLPVEQASVTLQDFRFVVHGESRGGKAPIYLLAGRLRDGMPYKNRERRRLRSGREVGTAPLVPTQSAESLSRWLGRRFLLFDAARERCRATVRRVGTIAPVDLSKPMVDHPDLSRKAWDVLDNEAWLTFELAVDGGANCRAAFWARSEDAVRPLLIHGRPTPMPPELEALFRRSRLWHEASHNFMLQALKTHEEAVPGSRMQRTVPDAGQQIEPGWDMWDQVRATTTRFAGTPGGDVYSIGVRSAYPPDRCKAGRCAEILGKPSTFAFRGGVERVESAWQSRDGEFKALRQERRIPKLLLAADLDGDGVVEFVSDTRLFHLRDGQLVQADNVSHWLR